MTKVAKNLYLDITLLITGIVCVLTGTALAIKPGALMSLFNAIHLKSLHVWASYLLVILVIGHLILHLDWIKAMINRKKI